MNAARQKRKRWLAIASMSAVLAVILVVNDRGLRYAARENPSSRVNWLFQSESAHYDMAILGSSIAKEGIDPSLLEELTGQRVVQLAWGGRGVSEQALYWELFLSRHTCDTLLLELHPQGLEPGVLAHPLDEFRYFPRLENAIVWRHLRRHTGLLQTAVWRWIPMWGLAQFSTQIGWHDVLALRREEAFDPNAPADNEHTGDADAMARARHDPQRIPGTEPVADESRQLFKEIVAISRKHNVKIVAFYPPMFLGSEGVQDRASLARYRSILGEDARIYDSQSLEFQHDASNFQDAFHLNREGSQQFTIALAEWLLESKR